MARRSTKRREENALEVAEAGVAVRRINFYECIPPAFWVLYQYLRTGRGREFFVAGGRGSCKSSFVSFYTLMDMISVAYAYVQGLIPKSELIHIIGYRKYATDIRDSIFAQFVWWIERLGLLPWFEINRSTMRIVFTPTRQMILFRGLDDPTKSKSIKAPFGFFKHTIFEEASQYKDYAEIRSVKQSVQRGGHGFITFLVYNPPPNSSNWINAEALTHADGRYLFRSDYRSVPVAWLGEDFVADAEDLRRRAPKVYEHEYLGEITGTGAECFPNLRQRRITDDEIRRAPLHFYGVDWGYIHASAWCHAVVYPELRRVLVVDEIYLHRAPVSVFARAVAEKDMDGEVVHADSADPAAIAEFNDTYGIQTVPVTKFADAKKFMIRWFQSVELIIDPWRCPNTAREMSRMEFSRDAKGNLTDEYPKINDDGYDGLRHALMEYAAQVGMF